MPFTPARNSPQAFTQYASLPRPPVGTALYDRVYNDDLLYIKLHLKSMVDTNRLPNMPTGFPFHYVYDGNTQSGVISYESYEFHQRFSPSDQRSRPQTATFSFTAPSGEGQYLSWQITVPWRELPSNLRIPCTSLRIPVSQRSTLTIGIPAKICIAQVDVDPIIRETSYGVTFMTDPRSLLTALSISIEQGVLITITVAKCKRPVIHPTDRNLDYGTGDIIFVATDNNHRSEVVLVFKLA